MFTGIIEEIGTVKSILSSGNFFSLEISCSFLDELLIGESVSVNGACLTVTKKNANGFFADVTPESFRRTSLGRLKSGSLVNLERAMSANGRFGGHIVTGHIDGTGKIKSIQKEGNSILVKINADKKITRYIVEKGSVCVDGISLTVSKIERNGEGGTFLLAVIPHTWEQTALKEKKSGEIVNIECDIVGKYIERFVEIKEDSNKTKIPNEFLEHFPIFHNL